MSVEKLPTEKQVEVLIKFCEEEWAQRRQSENQRATITNFVLTIASAVLVIIVQKGLNADSLPLAILLIPLGLYGALTSAKLYERGEFHINITKFWRKQIAELCPDVQLLQLREMAKSDHAAKFRVLTKVRLHDLWLGLHIGIVLVGVVLTLAIILR
ncbi:MAG: hypothetical protein WBW48_06285 [Anaerolineae bacterium]